MIEARAPRLNRRKGCIAVGVALVVVAVSFVLFVTWAATRADDELASFDPEKEPWRPVQVPLAQGSLRFEQRLAHPFLAEYSRRIVVSGQPEHQLDMPFNPGGRTLINVYWHDAQGGQGPWVRHQEYMGHFIVDLGSKPPRPWLLCEHEGERFLVAGECSWSRTNDEPWRPNGEHQPVPFSMPGRYLGRVDGRTSALRFVPAAEATEELIPLLEP